MRGTWRPSQAPPASGVPRWRAPRASVVTAMPAPRPARPDVLLADETLAVGELRGSLGTALLPQGALRVRHHSSSRARLISRHNAAHWVAVTMTNGPGAPLVVKSSATRPSSFLVTVSPPIASSPIVMAGKADPLSSAPEPGARLRAVRRSPGHRWFAFLPLVVSLTHRLPSGSVQAPVPSPSAARTAAVLMFLVSGDMLASVTSCPHQSHPRPAKLITPMNG